MGCHALQGIFLTQGSNSSLMSPACQCRFNVQSLSQEDPLEKEMATHSSSIAWEIPWTEESDGLQFMGLQKSGT